MAGNQVISKQLSVAAVGTPITDHNSPLITDHLSLSLARFDGVIRYLESRHLVNLLVEGHASAVRQAMSPWADRQAAADYALCSTAEIDRAADADIIKRHFRGSAPLFEKSDLDAAIREGRWLASKAGKRL